MPHGSGIYRWGDDYMKINFDTWSQNPGVDKTTTSQGVPGFLQEQKHKGIYKRKQQCFNGKIPLYKKISQHRKRDIYQQRHIADAKPGFVLNHRGNAV